MDLNGSLLRCCGSARFPLCNNRRFIGKNSIGADGRSIPYCYEVREERGGKGEEEINGVFRQGQAMTVGLNCALGAREMRPFVEAMANYTDQFVSDIKYILSMYSCIRFYVIPMLVSRMHLEDTMKHPNKWLILLENSPDLD